MYRFHSSNPTDPTEYDNPLAHNPCCTIQNVDACRAHQRSFGLRPPSLTSLPLFTLTSNNLIAPTRTNLCHHVPFHYLGFQFLHCLYLILPSSRHYLGGDYDAQLLENQASRVLTNNKLYASALRRAPLTHNPFLTQSPLSISCLCRV